MSAFALLLVAAVSAQSAPPPTFKGGVEGVYVDVFVTDDNRPVVGLAAAALSCATTAAASRSSSWPWSRSP